MNTVADAGYFLHRFADFGGGNSPIAVMDGFYGRKQSGIIQMDDFVAYLKGEKLPKPTRTTAIYQGVRNVDQVLEILNLDRHKCFHRQDVLSFRGQAGNHLRKRDGDRLIKRKIPNPYVCDEEGRERTIVPSLWRDISNYHCRVAKS